MAVVIFRQLNFITGTAGALKIYCTHYKCWGFFSVCGPVIIKISSLDTVCACWFLTSFDLDDHESASGAGLLQGWCKLPLAYGNPGRPTASTILLTTQTQL